MIRPPARLATVLGMLALLALLPAGELRAQGDPLVCSPTRDKTAAPTRIRLGETVEVTLEVAGSCPRREEKADVALVIDRSLSMVDDGKLDAAKLAATRFIDAVDPQLVHIGLIAFDAVVEEMEYLTDDKDRLRQSVADITWGRGTNLVDSLEAGRRMVTSAGARSDAKPVVVFLTDGRHRIQQPPLADIYRVIAQMKADGVTAYAIGLGNDVEEALLRQIADDPDRYHFSPGPDELEQIFLGIAGRIEASVLFRSITIDDIVPGSMQYVVGSSRPAAAWDPGARRLTWTLTDLPEAGTRLRYELIPREVGTHPTNVEATASYRDGFDNPGRIVFPIPVVEILPGEPGEGCVCRITRLKAPGSAIDRALADPDRVMGWNQLLDPNKPGAPPWPESGYDAPPNPRRTCLDIRNRAIHYHPLFNGVIWRAGCLEGPSGP